LAHPVRAEQRSPSADDAFGAYMQGAYDRLMQANPSLATEQGNSVGNDRWESSFGNSIWEVRLYAK